MARSGGAEVDSGNYSSLYWPSRRPRTPEVNKNNGEESETVRRINDLMLTVKSEEIINERERQRLKLESDKYREENEILKIQMKGIKDNNEELVERNKKLEEENKNLRSILHSISDQTKFIVTSSN